MKKVGLFFCLTLLLAFAGCSDDDPVMPGGGTELAKPAVGLTETTATSFRASWEAVDGAESYLCTLSIEREDGIDDEVSQSRSSATSLYMTDLQPETKYTLRVVARAAEGSGLEDSPACKIFVTTLSKESVPLTFESITLDEVGYSTARVSVVPEGDDLYYYAVVPAADVEGKSDEQVVEALAPSIASTSLQSGEIRKSVRNLTPETQYVAVAFGWNAATKKATSEVVRSEKVTTEADTRLRVGITTSALTYNSVHVVFAPSQTETPYYTALMKTVEVKGIPDEEVLATIKSSYPDVLTTPPHTGDFATDYDLDPGTSYTVVAFGYDAAEDTLTSEFSYAEFETDPIPGDQAFEITIEPGNVTAYGLTYNVAATDEEMYFYPMAFDPTFETQLGSEMLSMMMLSTLNEAAAAQGAEAVIGQMLKKGSQTIELTDELDPDTDYKIYVVGVAQAGEKSFAAVTGLASSDVFHTAVEVAEVPAVSIRYQIYDGSEIQGGTPGKAYIDVRFMPNAKTANYKFMFFTGESSKFSDAYLRYMLLAGGEYVYTDADTENNASATIGSYGEQFGLAVLAYGSDGKLGSLTRIDIPVENHGSGVQRGNGEAPETPTPSADFSKYLGEWTVTSTDSYSLPTSATAKEEALGPQSFKVRIESLVPDELFLVYDWGVPASANAGFLMRYDSATKGVSVSLAQWDRFEEGNISWWVVPMFAGNTYGNTNLDDAFTGAMQPDGTIKIEGSVFSFIDEQTEKEQDFTMESIVWLGVNKTTGRGSFMEGVQWRAAGPFTLSKTSSTAAAGVNRTVSRSLPAGSASVASLPHLSRFLAPERSLRPLKAVQPLRVTSESDIRARMRMQ